MISLRFDIDGALEKLQLRLGALISFVLFFFSLVLISLELLDLIDASNQRIENAVVRGGGPGGVSANQLSQNGDIPLFQGSNKLSTRLEQDIEMAIFVEDDQQALVDDVAVIDTPPEPEKPDFNWDKAVKGTLRLTGISTVSGAAYINGQRVSPGETIDAFPVTGRDKNEIATFIGILNEDSVTLEIDDQSVILQKTL
jgi:hypothetical protein